VWGGFAGKWGPSQSYRRWGSLAQVIHVFATVTSTKVGVADGRWEEMLVPFSGKEMVGGVNEIGNNQNVWTEISDLYQIVLL